MSNISVTLESTGTIPNLLKTIDKVLESEPKALTLLCAIGNEFSKETLDPLLTSLNMPVSGGLFHKIIHEDSLLDQGTIVIAWYKDVAVTNYKNIKNRDVLKELTGTTIESDQFQKATNIGEYLVFIDGAIPRLEENLDELYKKVGFRATFVGAGAGAASMESLPCIISNDGLLINTLQTIATNHKSKTTVTHGWKKQSGPHLVTSANRATIKALDFESIVPFYKKHNKIHGSSKLKNIMFSKFFTRYPIGIEKLDGEIIIRDPIKYTDDSIEYIGNIPEYSKIHILTGSVDSSREKIDEELEGLKLKDEKNIDTSFVFSCVNRDDIDGDGQSKEIKMLSKHLKGSKHIVGTLSLGEIATAESRLLHLHSKTIVISRLTGDL